MIGQDAGTGTGQGHGHLSEIWPEWLGGGVASSRQLEEIFCVKVVSLRYVGRWQRGCRLSGLASVWTCGGGSMPNQVATAEHSRHYALHLPGG